MDLSRDRSQNLEDLVRRLDEAVEAGDEKTTCRGVEVALKAMVDGGGELAPSRCFEERSDHYARRLLHADPQSRYTVIAMTWGPGQGTPLHDHGGSWGSVCVYRGIVRVTPYEPLGEPDGDVWQFRKDASIDAGRGGISSVIPPDDYHTIENPFDEAAVSIHVYRGEMQTAGCFLPTDVPGTYRRELKVLSYDA